ncbi:MAG TPA: DUF6265 family protein [Pyrinomonadaceae bacterium]|nr:DUF6265 family protein [Pyrinomonadaceae bacterium]
MHRKYPGHLVRLVIVLILGIISFSTTSVPSGAQERAFTLSDLSWLSGSWRTAPGGKMQIEEHWMAPAGNSMLGMSRTVAGDRTVEFEYLRLEQRAEAIYYVAHPKARCPGTDFKLTKLSGQEAVFENPAHDFPKRIIYQKGADGSLTASVDGGPGTKSMKFAYLPIAK